MLTWRLALSLCGIVLPLIAGICLDGTEELSATLEKQILSVHPPSPELRNSSYKCKKLKGDSHVLEDCKWQCIWEIHSPSRHPGLVLQVLDLDVEEDSGNFLEIRECGEESCPQTCGEEFEPGEEDDVDCHQWCGESGPEEQFETEESCVLVELSISGLSGRGLLLSYTSTIKEVVVVSEARLTPTHYILISVGGLTGLAMILVVGLIWTNRERSYQTYPRMNKPRIIFVTPATGNIDL